MEENKRHPRFFSLEWFKSKTENIIERIVYKRLDQLAEQNEEEYLKSNGEIEKPYRTIKMVNNVITIITNMGDIITKTNATIEDYEKLKKARTDYDLLCVIGSSTYLTKEKLEKEEYVKLNKIINGIEILSKYNEFTVEDNVVYFTGMSRSLPGIMVEELITLVQDCEENNITLTESDKFQSLHRFFMWCCLNPRPEVANELYRFLKENSFRITKQGFFVALRNVVTVEKDNDIVQFVSNAYNKVKAVWGRIPSEYSVIKQSGQYTCIHYSDMISKELVQYENIGNLKDLYLELPNMKQNRFTDHWTRTFDIRVGKVVQMPQEDCDWSTQDCATAGLHFTANEIHYVGCGDTSVLILINPMKVVGIGTHKGRCYEYLPIMTVPREEATQILHDGIFDTLQLDEEYAIRELENIGEKVKKGFAIEKEKHSFNLPTISISEISKITQDLSKMKEQITKRVSMIKE